jgi:hypothetical protein
VVHVLSERGKTIPTQNVALSRVANDVIRRMVSGEMDAETALRRLSDLSTRALDAPLWEHLGTFHHLQLDWDVAEKVGFDRATLLEEARRTGAAILGRGGLPSG